MVLAFATQTQRLHRLSHFDDSYLFISVSLFHDLSVCVFFCNSMFQVENVSRSNMFSNFHQVYHQHIVYAFDAHAVCASCTGISSVFGDYIFFLQAKEHNT